VLPRLRASTAARPAPEVTSNAGACGLLASRLEEL
jgi:hypothetical protein